MADFCQQCSIEIFGEDNRDLAGLGKLNMPPSMAYSVICEGCGATLVDSEGKCLLHDHDKVEARIHNAIEV